jgi:hypothetical protein
MFGSFVVNGKLDISAFRRVAALNRVVLPVLVLPIMPIASRESPSPKTHLFFQKIKLAATLNKVLRFNCPRRVTDRDRFARVSAFLVW